MCENAQPIKGVASETGSISPTMVAKIVIDNMIVTPAKISLQNTSVIVFPRDKYCRSKNLPREDDWQFGIFQQKTPNYKGAFSKTLEESLSILILETWSAVWSVIILRFKYSTKLKKGTWHCWFMVYKKFFECNHSSDLFSTVTFNSDCTQALLVSGLNANQTGQ